MKFQHKLLNKRWNKMPIIEQMANIGSEVGRAIKWKKEKDKKRETASLHRSLELFYFTMADPKNKDRLVEIARVKELLLDSFMGNNTYNTPDSFF